VHKVLLINPPEAGRGDYSTPPLGLLYLAAVLKKNGIPVDFDIPKSFTKLSPVAELQLLRIAQESLTNVARHAGVSTATVRLWTDEHAVHVQIEDQGAGFDPQGAMAAGSAGLASMRERAVLLGGELSIDSSARAGTHVTARLPLRHREER